MSKAKNAAPKAAEAAMQATERPLSAGRQPRGYVPPTTVTPAKAPKAKKKRFLLLAGMHEDEHGIRYKHEKGKRTIVESTKDLDKEFKEKFRRLIPLPRDVEEDAEYEVEADEGEGDEAVYTAPVPAATDVHHDGRDEDAARQSNVVKDNADNPEIKISKDAVEDAGDEDEDEEDTDEEEGNEEEKAPKADPGKDVTSEFPDAKAAGLTVFKTKGKVYRVTEKETPHKVVHKDRTTLQTKASVNKFLKDYE